LGEVVAAHGAAAGHVQPPGQARAVEQVLTGGQANFLVGPENFHANGARLRFAVLVGGQELFVFG